LKFSFAGFYFLVQDKFIMPSPKSWMSLWVIGTVGGAWLGSLTMFGLALLTKGSAEQSYLLVIVFGICIGFCQWAVALRGIVNGLAWTVATSTASLLIALAFDGTHQLIPQILEYYNPGCLSASCDSYRLSDGWAIGTLLSIIIVVIAIALPTGVVLSRHASKLYMWILGSIIGSIVWVLGFILISVSIPGGFEELCWSSLILPIVIALITAPFIYRSELHRIRT
jgi:hypothetical protein